MNIKVIGVDEYTEPTATLAALSGAAGYVAVDVDALSLNLDPAFEGDIIQFASGLEKNYGIEKVTGELILNIVDYPTTPKTFAELYPELAAIRKNFVYLYAADYNLFIGTVSGKAVNVVIDGYKTTLYGGGIAKQRIYSLHINQQAEY